MIAPNRNSALAQLTPRGARWLLVAIAIVVATMVGITLSPLKSGFADAPSRGPGDVALYQAEVRRMSAGEGYYSAAAAELRSRGYPTRSIFNWRAPLPLWLIGNVPDVRLAQGLLGLAALGVLVLGFAVVADSLSVRAALVTTVLVAGALLPCVLGELFVMPEIWSGVLVALSLLGYASDRRRLGVAAGLAALFMRELAAPYCLLSLVLAVRERRRGESVAWLIGLAAYAAYYALHVRQVLPLIQPDDLAHTTGWMRFGGAAFVISTVQMNAWLLLLPQWVTALFFVLAMLGFAAWQSPAGERFALTAALFTLGFGLVGHDFNQYWGSMTAPLLAVGPVRGAVVLAGIFSVARQNRLALRSTA